MKRPKTRVLVESAADATVAARALLAFLHSIDEEAFLELLLEYDLFAGMPADHRLRDELLTRVEMAIGKALPAGYFLSNERVRRTGVSGYVLRREGEEELDEEGVLDRLSSTLRAPPDATRAIERNATGLGPVEKQPKPPVGEAWDLSAESHHALGRSERGDFPGSARDLEAILMGWLGVLTRTEDDAWWPGATDLRAGEALVDDGFRGTFNAVCRDALPYALRFIDFIRCDELLFFVAYHVWRDFKGAAERGLDPSAVSRAVIVSAVRRMRVTDWKWPSAERDDPDPEAYRQAAKALGMTDPAVRRAFHEMLMRLRGVLGKPLGKVRDSDLRAPVADVHPDFALVGDLLAGVLSPADELLFETRIRNDASAFERMWPLVEAWDSNWTYPAAQRIAGLIGGRLGEPDDSVSGSPPQALSLAGDQALDGMWTSFVGRVGAESLGKLPAETELLSAMEKDWRAAIAEHARSRAR